MVVCGGPNARAVLGSRLSALVGLLQIPGERREKQVLAENRVGGSRVSMRGIAAQPDGGGVVVANDLR